MAFVKINKPQKGSRAVGYQVTMASYLGGDKNAMKSRSVVFSFSGDLVEALGWVDETTPTNIQVMEGVGPDQGFLKLMQADNGYRLSTTRMLKTLTGKMHSANLTTAAGAYQHYVLNECPVGAMLVNHIVDDAGLIVEVPDWFRFNPASVSPAETTRVEPPPAPAQVHHLQQKRKDRR